MRASDSAATPGGAVPFRGRDRELAALTAAIRLARRGEPRVLAVVGDAGAGKTRLINEAAACMGARVLVMSGGGVDLPGIAEAQIPFGPFAEALRRVLPRLDSASAGAAAAWLSPGDEESAAPFHTSARRFLSLLEGISRATAVMLVLEDLQWADHSSLALLVFLARNLVDQRVIVVATARPPDRDSPLDLALAQLERIPLASSIAVGPLCDGALREIVEAAAQTLDVRRSARSADIAAAVTLAEGSPLAALELGLALKTTRTLGDGLPTTLTAAVRGRVRSCSAPARAVLAALAVAGDGTQPSLLQRLVCSSDLALDAEGFLTALVEASRTGLLLPEGTGYRFRHALDRHVVYQDLATHERRRWHARVADALVHASPHPVLDIAAQIAAHYEAAQDRDAVRTYALVAARGAAGMSAWTEAATHYRRVLAQWNTSITTAEVEGGPGSALLTEAAEAALWAGHEGEAMALARAAIAAAADPDEADLARERLAQLVADSGDSRAAMATCDLALAAMQDRQSKARGRMLATRARSLMMLYRYRDAAAVARAALTCAVEPSGPAGASALITLGYVVAMIDDATAGFALLDQGRSAAMEHGHDDQFWRAVANTSHIQIALGRYQEAADGVLAAMTMSTSGTRSSAAVVNAIEALTSLGRWSQALQVAESPLRNGEGTKRAVWLRPALAFIHLLQGEIDAAEALLVAAREDRDSITDPEHLAELAILTAQFALQAKDVHGARTAIDDALNMLSAITEDPQPMIEALAVAARIEGDVASAAALRDPARLARLGALLEARAQQVRKDQHDLRFYAALADAELDRARLLDSPSCWQSVALEAATLRRPYDEAYGRLRLAEAALARGQQRLAAPALREAYATVVRLGAAPLEELIRRAAQRGRVPLDTRQGRGSRLLAARPTPNVAIPRGRATAPIRHETTASAREAMTEVPSKQLTTRELEILRLLETPLSQSELARTLFLSPNTVKSHLRAVYRKLGATSRDDAVRCARRLGLI